MHLNYHFFKRLIPVLDQKLTGKKLLTCFSQEKDELVLGFGDATGDFYIRCSVLSTFGGLYFTESFQRARKNSVDLFEHFLDLKVTGVRLFRNERAFQVNLAGDKAILFKMFGNRSNILGIKNEEVTTLFNHRLPEDSTLNLKLDREIDQSFEAFKNAGCNPLKVFPTWGKLPLSRFESQKTGQPEEDWLLCEAISKELENGKFYITKFKGKQHLSLTPVGEITHEFEDPLQANNAFFIERLKVSQLNSEQNQALKQLSRRIEQTQSYLQQAYKRLDEMISAVSNQNLGHLIMANLYQIPENAESVTLPDFETGEPVKIKLKSHLSAQKNAEVYYRKAKNEKLEFDHLEENIASKEALLKSLEEQKNEIEAADSLKELRGFVKMKMPSENRKAPKKAEDLFKCYEKGGFRIWVGRNAKNNDLLTLKYADKNDTWLHAKDVSGSHVVIKQIPGSNIPKDVLEWAASVAAFYSKRKTDTLVAVAYTLKKYVRKVKGAPDGQVLVEKEDVMLVKPFRPD